MTTSKTPTITTTANTTTKKDKDGCVGILRIAGTHQRQATNTQGGRYERAAALAVWGQPVVLRVGTFDAINDQSTTQE